LYQSAFLRDVISVIGAPEEDLPEFPEDIGAVMTVPEPAVEFA